MKKSNIFWISYSDLMTSLFFIMLVLYVITFIRFIFNQRILADSAEQLEEIRSVEDALATLNPTYFEFNEENKRFKLKVDVNFPSNEHEIYWLSDNDVRDLKEAGKVLYNKIDSLVNRNPNVDYLLIIEGTTQKAQVTVDGEVCNNWECIPDDGYILSYKRALSLFNLWKDAGYDFSSENEDLNGQCEVIIAGSGYFGFSRDEIEKNNRRFTIQITSKVGKYLYKQTVSE